jgi:hypothetical protein
MIGVTRYSFGSAREQRKRVTWFLSRAVGGFLRLEPIFREAVLLDEAGSQSVLTHASDRDIARRAFAAVHIGEHADGEADSR